jgi:hypothetical protein
VCHLRMRRCPPTAWPIARHDRRRHAVVHPQRTAVSRSAVDRVASGDAGPTGEALTRTLGVAPCRRRFWQPRSSRRHGDAGLGRARPLTLPTEKSSRPAPGRARRTSVPARPERHFQRPGAAGRYYVTCCAPRTRTHQPAIERNRRGRVVKPPLLPQSSPALVRRAPVPVPCMMAPMEWWMWLAGAVVAELVTPSSFSSCSSGGRT